VAEEGLAEHHNGKEIRWLICNMDRGRLPSHVLEKERNRHMQRDPGSYHLWDRSRRGDRPGNQAIRRKGLEEAAI